MKANDSVVAVHDENSFQVERSSLKQLTLLLNDEFVDLDKPVTVNVEGQKQIQQTPNRTIASLVRSLRERDDPAMMFSAEIDLEISPSL